MSDRCTSKVPNRLPYHAPPTQCERDAADGQEFCWQHNPDRLAVNKRKRELGYTVDDLRRRVHLNRPAAVGQAYLDGDADALVEAVAEYNKVRAELVTVEAELLALKKGKADG